MRAEALEAVGHQHAVLTAERHDVGGGRGGDEVEQVEGLGGVAPEAHQDGLRKLVAQPAAGELLERVAARVLLGSRTA